VTRERAHAWPAILSALDPVGHPRIPQVALQGVDAHSTHVLWAQDLSKPLHDVPEETVLGIFEAARPDGRCERRVFLNRRGQPAVYLGPLTRQLDDAPVDTLFVQVGSLPLILGYIHPDVFSAGGNVILRTESGVEENGAAGGGALRRMVGYHGFILAVFERKEDWNTISGLKLRGSAGSFTWKGTFEPPIDTRPLWIRVP
jgi:hypothetical protein